jgi:hypothetical protein
LAALFLFSASLIAQNTTVVITDGYGHQTTGTISNGNVYFHDSKGNSAFGTIDKNGSVFVTTNKGQITFGTIKDGNVFLSDSHGNTTGTIQNGNIFLRNSDGSITTGTYDTSGHVQTYTTESTQERQQEQQQQLERQRQIDQENYQAGQAVGTAVGNAIAAGIAGHHITRYCKDNPTGSYLTSDNVSIDCPNSTFDSWQQQQVDSYCADHPGSYTGFGRHLVNCYTAPNPPNLKWAIWEMKWWRWDYKHPNKLRQPTPLDQIAAQWSSWQGTYCNLAPGHAAYQDLNGKKRHCD